MRVFVRAVITGIGLSVGKAIYDKVSERFFGKDGKRADADQPVPVVPGDDAAPIAKPH